MCHQNDGDVRPNQHLNGLPDVHAIVYLYRRVMLTTENVRTRNFIYDVDLDEMLSLKHLFEDTPKALVEIRQLAKTQLKSTFGEMLFIDELAPYPANYQSVVLSGESNALIFTFDTVTSTTAGPQQVSIPLHEISDLLSDRVFVYRKG